MGQRKMQNGTQQSQKHWTVFQYLEFALRLDSGEKRIAWTVYGRKEIRDEDN